LDPSPRTAGPVVEVRPHARVVIVRDPRAFGADGSESAYLFIRRVFAVRGVRSISLDRVATTATIGYDEGATLAQLAAALRGALPALDASAVPRPAPGRWSLYRHGDLLSTLPVLADAPGRLRIRLPENAREHQHVLALEARLSNIPGIADACHNRWTASLTVAYDPALLAVPVLMGAIERTIEAVLAPATTLVEAPEAVSFTVPNTTLAVAVAGEVALPALSPVSAVLLVGTNVTTFKQAAVQLRRGEVGLPVLYTTIVGTSLISGHFVASALMTWTFRYWKQRAGDDLQRERLRLADSLHIEASRLRPGDRIIVESGAMIPADGRVESGSSLVDDRHLPWGGVLGVRGLGEQVAAGAIVRNGRLRMLVERTGATTRAAAIGRLVEAATRPGVKVARPSARPERFIVPTLAVAGVGMLAGGVTTAGALLRPDYATGPGVAESLEALRGVALGLSRGVLVRDPSVFSRLAHSGVIVLDDHPALHRQGLDLALFQSPLPETDAVLRYAASVARHLADDRAQALASACRSRSLPMLRLDAEEVGESIVARHGRRHLRLYELSSSDDPAAPICLEVDGTFVGTFRFRRSRRPAAAPVLARLRERTKAPFVLLSDRPAAEAATRAAALGVDQHLGGLSTTDTARFLDDCMRRGLRPAWVGDARTAGRLAPLAHVAIVHAGDLDVDLDTCPADALLLAPSMEPLADLWDLAAGHADCLRAADRLVLVPNLLAVAGAFTMGFTSLTSVVLSNFGTYQVYKQTSSALRQRGRPDRALVVPRAPEPTPRAPQKAGATRVVATA
jgi:cation transport ATPase